MPVFRMTMTWTGFPGSPGYTNLHFLNPETDPGLPARDAAAAKVRTFFQAFINYVPAGINIDYPSVMQVFNTGTGALEQEQAITKPATTVCGGTGNWSSAVGACVNWNTQLLVNGRKLRGRTFIVPLASSVFDTQGTLSDSPRGNMLTAAQTLLGPTDTLALAVWHKPDPGTANGVASQIHSASIRDKTAILRSRRD